MMLVSFGAGADTHNEAKVGLVTFRAMGLAGATVLWP